MKDRLFEALKDADADYADIRVEREESTRIAYRGRELESADGGDFVGGVARACARGGWGTVTFDTLDDLPLQVREACRCAALAGRETTRLAETPIVDEERPARLERDFRGVSVDDKLRLVRGYNDILLGADPAVETSHVAYADRMRTVHFASSRGSYFMEERPRVTCRLMATARRESLVQRAFETAGSVTTYNAVLGLETLAEEVGRRAAALLRAPKVEGGRQTVILDPRLAGVFAHEAFGHLSEADFLYENPKLLELMPVGREIGAPELNIVDNGSIPGAAGTLAFDDEGTPTGETYLIRDGVLAAHLHSRETAAKMGEKPTGNARAVGRRHPPIVRMTNTMVRPGTMPASDLFAGTDRGVYALAFFGGQTCFEMFTFSAAYGYRIENGKRGELVRDITLSGNLFETLRAIDGIADDFRMTESGGGCGKGGQAPLPVGMGAPHVRIRNAMIG